MKKIALWFLSTLSVVVLMFGYHTSTSGAQATSAPTAIYSGSTTGSSSARSSSGSSGSSSGSSSTSPKPSSPSSPSSPATKAVTFTGSQASTEWGTVQVALAVKDGTITGVSVPLYPHGNGTDAQINSYALPALIKETLAAQSAQIDMISGATVTSGGYLQSLQSAIDQAGL